MQQLMPILITLYGYWGIQITIVHPATVWWLLTKLIHEMCFPMTILRVKCCLRQRKSDMGYIQVSGNLVYLESLFALSTNFIRCHSINRLRIWLCIFQWILNSLFWTGLNLRKHIYFNSELLKRLYTKLCFLGCPSWSLSKSTQHT